MNSIDFDRMNNKYIDWAIVSQFHFFDWIRLLGILPQLGLSSQQQFLVGWPSWFWFLPTSWCLPLRFVLQCSIFRTVFRGLSIIRSSCRLIQYLMGPILSRSRIGFGRCKECGKFFVLLFAQRFYFCSFCPFWLGLLLRFYFSLKQELQLFPFSIVSQQPI